MSRGIGCLGAQVALDAAIPSRPGLFEYDNDVSDVQKFGAKEGWIVEIWCNMAMCRSRLVMVVPTFLAP